MTSVGTYWRTVRHLRMEQVWGRLRHRLHRPSVRLLPAPRVRRPNCRWTPGACREPSLVGPCRWRFLNQEQDLPPGQWDDPALPRLWRYNLHYFDDLNARDSLKRNSWHQALMDRWIAENPPPRGTAWEPYPVSLRVVNWIKWSLGGQPLSPACLHSLAIQVRWLRDRLETHLLGNHLFVNAKALLFAGLFFEGAEAQRWLEDGIAILARELDEQILMDGGHFERSPMYHALALEDVLDLLDVIGAYDVDSAAAQALQHRLRAKVPAMQRWLAAMTHPDGTFGMFNDCAMGIAPERGELDRFARRLGLAPPDGLADEALRLEPSGYVRLAHGAALALLDVAPIEPAYLPGHAHADTLAFELSLHGHRVVVNGGTSRYGDDARRLHERSTAAHSTVQVANADSSEVWAGFRVGRRAHPHDLQVHAAGPAWQVECSHDGYRYLDGHPVHRRRWRLEASTLQVDDSVNPSRHPAVARYLFAPSIRLRQDGPARWHLGAETTEFVCVEVLRGSARIEPVQVTTRFGILEDSLCLAVTLDENGQAGTRWSWSNDAHPVPH